MRSVLASLVLLAACLPAYGQLWDKELMANGDAEKGVGATSRSAAAVKDIPGWTTTGNFTLCQYVNGMNNDVRYMKTPGKQYFAGGPNGGAATARQTIDLSSGAAEIDAGRVRFFLTGWIGNGGDQMVAPAKLTATFLDGAGKSLLEYTVNGPTLAEASSVIMLWRSGSGFVLPNTRSVQILLDLGGKSASFNAAAADNLSFRVSLVPILGTNLAVNGDAEAQTPDQVPPGWNSGELIPLKANSFKFVEPAAAALGTYLFTVTGGVGVQTGTAYQTIDVTLVKDRIDAGGVKYNLAALLGGHESYPDDWVSLKLDFLNASGKPIGNGVKFGPLTAADRASKTTFVSRSSEGTLPAGARQLQLTLEYWAKNGNFGVHVYADNISLTLSSGGVVSIKEGGVVNAATGDPGPLAPGEMILVSTTGVNLDASARTQLDATGKVSTSLGDVRLFFDGAQAPLLSVASGQIGAVVPFDVEGKGNVQVRIEYQGAPSPTVEMGVVSTSPGVFTQDGAPSGVGLIYNADYTLNGKDNPAAEGSPVTIFWTGGGQTDPGGVDGRIELMPLSRPRAAVSVTIGGQAADLIYAGGAPYAWSGLLMAEVKTPAGVAGEEAVAAPVVITAGSASSPDKRVVMWVKK
jgi:uncharacterized protein (TIGR03437 family)